MLVPYHSIHKSSYIVTQVFHGPYYEDRAHVTCSVSRSDGDSNRFLISWRVIPHTNHTTDQVIYKSPYYTIQDQFAGLTGTTCTRGLFRRLRYPMHTKVARHTLVVLLNQHQYSAYIELIPGPDGVQASQSERLILPAKCGACVPHDKRAINNQSSINTGRGTMVNTTIRPCPVSVSYPHLVTFHHSIKQLDT